MPLHLNFSALPKRSTLTLLLVLLLSLITLEASLPTPGSAQDLTGAPSSLEGERFEEPPSRKEIAVEPRARDEEITARLTNILNATDWFTSPRVDTRAGVVFLDGIALEESHKDWATELAQSTQDVVAVVNKMEVRPEVRWDLQYVQRELSEVYWQAARAIPLVLLAIFVLALSWVASLGLAMLARRGLRHRIPSPLLLRFVARAVAIPVFLLGLYFVLKVANLTGLALTVLGGTGIVGIVLGFASRDIVENFLASFFLSLDRPFRTGDFIEVAGAEGVVDNLNTRSTVLLTLDGAHIQIPNSLVFKDKITNHSSTPYRRSEFPVGIGYDNAITQVQELILTVLKQHTSVLDTPEPLVLVDNLGSATVNLKCLYWFNSETYSPIKIKSALLRLTKQTLTEAGISMPDEAREVVFPEGVPVVGISDNALRPDKRARVEPRHRNTERSQTVTEAEGGLLNEEGELKSTIGKVGKASEVSNLLEDPVDPTDRSRRTRADSS
jgi:small-conductance mechanosensitive channel